MKVTEFNKSHLGTICGIITVTLLTLGVIVPLDTALSHLLTAYADELMALFLLTGFLGLVVRHNTTILVNFMACITICSFLKNSENQPVALHELPSSDDVAIRVAHLVLDDEESIAEFGRDFHQLKTDFLSIQTPIQPTLEKKLTEEISKHLPYWDKTTCDNNLTMFVFSAYELRDLDTLYYHYNNSVSLVGTMFIGDAQEEVSFLSTRVPAGNDFEAQKQLAGLSNYIRTNCQNKPFLTLSGMQVNSTIPQVQAFKATHRLNESRMNKGNFSGDEHIFYSKDLTCTEFSEIFDGNGVIATYRFKKSNKNALRNFSDASSFIKGTPL